MESCGTWPEEIMTDTQNEASLKLSRRSFAVGTAAAVVGIAFNFRDGTDTVNAKSGAPKEVKLVEFSDTGQRGETVTQPMVVKSDAEVAPGADVLRLLGEHLAVSPLGCDMVSGLMNVPTRR